MTPQELARECARKHSDFTDALDEWEQRLPETEGYEKYVSSLIRTAGNALISQARHATNVSIRRQTGKYSQPPKVKPGTEVIEIELESVYDYRIGGSILGNLLFEELPDIAEDEAKKSNSHRFNATLLRVLYSRSSNKSIPVREGISEENLRELFTNLNRTQKLMAGC